MSPDLFDSLLAESAKAIAPLRAAAAGPDALEQLLAQVGLDAQSAGGSALAAALQSVVTLADDLEQLSADPEPSFAGIAAVLEAIRGLVSAVQGLSGAGGPASEFESFGTDLIEVLAIQYLWNWHPLLHELAVLATLIEPADQVEVHPAVVKDGLVVRAPFVVERLRLEQLGALIRDPAAALRAEYGNPLATVDDANAVADKLFPRVLGVLRTLGVVCRYGFDPTEAPLLGDSASFVDHALIIYTADELAEAAAEAGVVVAISSADRGDLGFVFTPFGTLSESRQLGNWNLELDVDADVQAIAVGRHGVSLLAEVDDIEVTAKLTTTLAAPDNGPAYVVGSTTGSRLEVGGMTLALQTTLSAEQLAFSMAGKATKAAIVIAASDGDGFLQSVLPAGGLRTEFDLGINWTSGLGLSIDGSAGLKATLPARLSIAGVATVTSIHLELEATDAGAQAEVSLTVAFAIGPIRAVADRIGITAALGSSDDGGNLGSADLQFGFKAPSGVGLSVDAAGVVSGGGFLAHSGGEYSGSLDLSLLGEMVKAYGLIQTALPGGRPGYSLVAVISEEFSPAVQLPFGFSLEGVGGLIGVNRSISEDAVEAALWAHHLDGLLFPKDPVASAPQLLSALDSYFPAAEGRYVVGPLAKIGWSAGLVVGEVGLLFELPEPLKVLLVGEVQIGAPAAKPVLVLHISFAGGIDFGKKLAFFDATLHDSKLAGYPLSGDLAFRYGWGDDAVFALALGGFHPSFQPPAGFPTLKRLAISISSSVAKLEAQSYIALTSNTLQFGARVELTAGGHINVHGWLGFDALVEWDPLSFEFDLSAGVDLRAGTDVLASVHLDGTLSGPTPWHIAGKASLSLLFFDVSVHFDKTWGDDAVAVSAPDPLPVLVAALADRSAWTGLAAAGTRPAITPVAAPDDAPDALLVDPAGGLRIAQRAVPLDQPITRFAGTSLGRTATFSLDALTAFGAPVAASNTTSEQFAPGQFLDFTDAEKLSLPSFERFDAGVEIGTDAVDLGHSPRTRAVETPIAYDTTIVDSRTAPPADPYQPTLTAVLALNQNTTGPNRRYGPPPGTPPAVTLTPDRWIITDTTNLDARTDIPADNTKLGAHLALQHHLTTNPTDTSNLQITLTEEAA